MTADTLLPGAITPLTPPVREAWDPAGLGPSSIFIEGHGLSFSTLTIPTPTPKEPTLRAYLAGPMRGLHHYGFPIFDSAQAWLEEDGYKVVSPAALDRAIGFDETDPDPLPDGFMEAALRRDVEALLNVDIIVLLPGWQDSVGARLELDIAKALGLPAYELLWDHAQDVSEDGGLPLTSYGWTELRNLADVVDEGTVDRTIFVPSARLTVDGEKVGTPLSLTFTAESVSQDAMGALFGLDCGPLPELPESAYPPEATPLPYTYDDAVFEPSPTGGVKGVKPQQPHQIPPRALLALGEVYAKGAEKYPDAAPGTPNWALGYPWSKSYSALGRHLGLFWSGQDVDAEDGLHHLLHAAWHCLTLYTWQTEGIAPEMDDRPTYYRKAVA